MTDEAIRKISLMYKAFGWYDGDAICRDCSNLQKNVANRTHYKCLCYGDTASEATDWRIGWIACGMFNKPYDGKPLIEVKKHLGRKKLEVQIEGQITLQL